MMGKKSEIANSFAISKQLAILIDPDNCTPGNVLKIINESREAQVDYIFVGGSLLFHSLDDCISLIRSACEIPIVLFPGNVMQISENADAILFLSLISGRNPEYLIGHHVVAAPFLKRSGLEILPTAYILIENGKQTSVQYMSNTSPIPADKPEIAIATAMAGEMLGLRYIYLEAGSGASNHVGQTIVSRVKENTSVPLIVGGGITSAENAAELYNAGASLLVVGNAIEKDFSLIKAIAAVRGKKEIF
ncbi:MAG: geranylgeranylglyceryl/heptaprenylglyceryl phosphate synthase [Bacteroidales bacterium]|nr:geranylgeranylglyceryl/heptaprenylglyceryl phosphate synthase [Bacteroidales bacterium]